MNRQDAKDAKRRKIEVESVCIPCSGFHFFSLLFLASLASLASWRLILLCRHFLQRDDGQPMAEVQRSQTERASQAR
jgi:hypothetical protein